MHQARRIIALAVTAAILAACGKSQNAADGLPLTYAPADTPYAYANLEPTSKTMLDQSSKQMQAIWPTAFGMYDGMLQRAAKLDEREKKIAAAVLDELRSRDSLDKLREIGFKPDGHIAMYGVGLIPVVRMELGDVAAFKAMIARIETKVGEKIPTGKVGEQEYWQFGDDKVNAIVAIQGTHLVATLWAPGVNDTVKQTLLGIVKPAKNLADAGTLQALAKQYNYTPNGEGYIDFVRLAERLTNAPSGTDLEIAKAMHLPTEAAVADPACKAEFTDLAHKFPRIVAGVESATPQKIKIGAQLEIEPALAGQLAAALTPAPGTGVAVGANLFDFSIALPVLKLKDFAIKQAEAVAAKPFACAELVKLNASFAQMKTQIDTTIPPPFADITGFRISLTKLEPKGVGIPDFAGKILIGSSNPLAAIAMAQLAVPQLKNLKIAADGKPVALPTGLVPLQLPPLSLAVSDKAIAISAGAGEDAALGSYLADAPASTPVFIRTSFSGALYGLLARYMDVLKNSVPADQQADLEQQPKLMAVYEKMIRSGEFGFEANAGGIGIHETVEVNP